MKAHKIVVINANLLSEYSCIIILYIKIRVIHENIILILAIINFFKKYNIFHHHNIILIIIINNNNNNKQKKEESAKIIIVDRGRVLPVHETAFPIKVSCLAIRV